jgi:hypothetical protein
MTDARDRLMRLSRHDNVAVAIETIGPGETATAGDFSVAAAGQIPAGHKIAVVPIPAGTKVLKYGLPIGSATRHIAAGEHVHTHNLKSDYLPE